jgi:hypothetical protein
MTMIDTRASHTASFTEQHFSVLFLCMGNICRSPTAHGVFRQKVQHAGLAHKVFVTSAGTHPTGAASMLLASGAMTSPICVLGN